MEIVSANSMLIVAIAEILAVAACMLVIAFLFVRRLRQSLRQLHLKLGALGSQMADVRQEASSIELQLKDMISRVSTLNLEAANIRSGVSALQTEASDHQKRLAALSYVAERTRDIQKTLKNDLALLHLVSGKQNEASDIVVSETDSYDRLDENWGSIHATAGRRESRTAIDGERKRTAVIAILGQSNAANHGSGQYSAQHRVDNFNIYDSKIYHAADPLLGASGDGGNFATRLGDKLIEAGLFDRVILAPIAMGGTTVEQWADEGMFNRRIIVLIRRLHDIGLNIDYILWHQGEGNNGMGDREGRQYRKNLWEVVSTFRRYGVNAPFFVSLATFCVGPHANAENIRAGQKSAVDPRAGIFLGPDTDLIGPERRWDGCHFNEIGLDMAAALWLEVIADFQFATGAKKHENEPHSHPVERRTGRDKPWHRLRSLTQHTIMSQLSAAFAVENGYCPAPGRILVSNERLAMATIASSDVAACLNAADLSRGTPAMGEPADMVVAWEGLRHAFRPRAALDSLCGYLNAGGRLIYAQRLGGLDYLGLTPKWFLDYFVEARYADCRIYLLWPPDQSPKVATFDYRWMLDNAHPIYTPMWENITYAAALVVVAEKGTDSDPDMPSQDIYRLPDEWERYATGLGQLITSARPWHITGPVPDVLPAGCCGVQ
jgi:regulator of replication initiation timing